MEISEAVKNIREAASAWESRDWSVIGMPIEEQDEMIQSEKDDADCMRAFANLIECGATASVVVDAFSRLDTNLRDEIIFAMGLEV